MGKVSGALIEAPGALRDDDELSAFDSGEPDLDRWLKQRAWDNEQRRASRTYVVRAEARVIAYYALAAGSVLNASTPGKIRRNMPDPIPVMVLGRLAVDRAWQGKGIGNGLLRDAILRTLQAGQIAGIRVLLVHAISEDAQRLYEKNGFVPSPLNSMTLMLSFADVEGMA